MNQTEFIEFFKELLKLQSYDPLNSKVPEFLVETLKKYGIQAEVINSKGYKSVVAATKGDSKILFNGHWDTVLPNDSYRKADQDVKEEGGYIYALGACDMKSGVAAMTAAFIEAYKNNIKGVVLNIVPDEELGGKNGTQVLIKKGYNAPNVVICEPTNLDVSLGQKGGIFVTVKAKGVSGHGAYPNRGVNAILKVTSFYKELLEIYPLPTKENNNEEVFSVVTASLNKIDGGDRINVIPDSCIAEIDTRIPPQVPVNKVKKTFKDLAKKHDIEVDFDVLGTGWELNKDTKLFESASKALNDVLKKEPNYVRKMGSNDGKYYAETGSNIINIGPGDNKLSHTVNEKVSIKELLDAKETYYLLLNLI